MNSTPPEAGPETASSKTKKDGGVPVFHKMLARAIAHGYVPHGGEEEVQRTPEEQERAEAISASNLSAAEAKRLRRQQRNLLNR